SGQPFDRRTRDRLRRTWRNGGPVIITDDPPTSGRSLTRLAQVLLGLGAPARAIVPLIQTFEGPAWWSWQTPLATYAPIVLPWTAWTIQQRLEPTSAQQALRRLLTGKTVRLPGAGNGWQEVCVGAVSHVERISPLRSVPGRQGWVEGRDGIGQRCADLLSPGFGRAAPLARRALRRTFEAMVTPGRRCLIDGDMLPAHWFLEPGTGRLLKVHPAEDAFWSGG